MGRESELQNHEITDKARVTEYLKMILSKGMKLPVNKIEAFVPFENYGIDSILTMKLTMELEKVFGSLSKTLFFEYRNLDELTAYFYTKYYDKLKQLNIIAEENITQENITQEKQNKRDNTHKAVNDETKNDLSYIFGSFDNYEPVVCRYNADNEAFDRSLQTEKSERFSAEKGTDADNKVMDIAIIGLAGKYPKASNVDEFWKNLSGGIDCITEIPKERWDNDFYFDPDKNKKKHIYAKWGGFIDGVDEFDPRFFHISPKEAKGIDPQERLFLECAYHAMEDAGYTKENIAKQGEGNLGCNVGVYVGVMFDDYQLFGVEEQMKGNIMALTGVSASIANRVSYTFNFNGPSMVIGTQCSSSLTSIHLACQSLKDGECEVAVAGGVNVSLHPNKYILLSQGKFLSSDGHCISFGKDGDGYVPSEGVGAVILKPLYKAEKDGDHIYGVIRGCSVNHGGKTNGYTVPNPIAQGELIDSVLKRTGINPRTVSYIEAHGTGTALGDPIEITGLCRAFEKYTQDKGFCEIGSVKSNIGHCESAAGIASLTKVLLQMKHKQIAPSIHSKVLNPYIDFENTPFHVTQELQEWKRPVVYEEGKAYTYPLRAGISSFGAGGANAHLLIEEYIPKMQENPAQPPEVMIVLSAKTKDILRTKAEQLYMYIKENEDLHLSDIAYTLAVGREHMNTRAAFVADGKDELLNRLMSVINQQEDDPEVYYGDKERGIADFMGDGMQSYVQTLIEKQDYSGVLKLWVNGIAVAWDDVYNKANCRRVSLPGYPFERQKFWLDRTEEAVLREHRTISGKAETTNQDKIIAEEVQGHVISVKAKNEHIDIRKKILEEIAEIIEEILMIPKDALDYEESFVDFGFDSLTIVELAGEIGKRFDFTLTPDIIYSYQNMNRLKDYLIDTYKEKIERVYCAQETESDVPQQQADEQKILNSSYDIAAKADDNAKSAQVAVVGIAGRFPDARNTDQLWDIVKSGKSVIRKVPQDRKDWSRVYEGLSEEECEKYKIGVIPGADEFDADFFEITPIEAESMDPRQRILLEEMWHALEDAGYGEEELKNDRIGIFVGAEESEYRNTLTKEIGILSNHNAVLAARLAYILDLHGPNFTLNTACSSGLVALHLAQESIKNGECDAAIVGGVNMLPLPDIFIAMQKAGMLSPNSVCSPFGNNANGMVAAEAAAVIVLKRADLARKDGQHIYATIAGSGINYDGKTNGLTAPSGQAQTELLNQVYDRCNINVEDIGYMLAHGTGTKLGDPIEVNSVTNVWKKRTKKQGFCALGSVKANVGHTQAASGLVSLITLIKAMENETIPASINCEQLNEYIDWNESPFFIAGQNRIWHNQNGQKKYGAVSAFGVSGTNAHIVLQHEEENKSTARTNEPQLLVFSAKTEEALLQKMRETASFIEEKGSEALQEIAYTLLNGRVHFAVRCALVVSSAQQAVSLLKKFSLDTQAENVFFRQLQVNYLTDNEIMQTAEKQVEQALGFLNNPEEYEKALKRLAKLFCDGYENAVQKLYKNRGLRKISMNGYPFAKNHYWGDKAVTSKEVKPIAIAQRLHPMVHANVSTLYEQTFQSEFTGTEEFFQHHIIGGIRTLPAVAYLEMAREAIHRSATGNSRIILRNIGWFQPIQIKENTPCKVKIKIGENHNKELEFLISSDYGAEEAVNCRGNVILTNETDIPAVDYKGLSDEDSQVITRDESYQLLQAKDMHYGLSLRTIQKIRRKENKAVVELNADNRLFQKEGYGLYYGIMDGALQATIAFNKREDSTLVMPYAIEKVVIYDNIQPHMWALIEQKSAGKLLKYNIDLCDEAGNVCVHFEDYTARAVQEAAEKENEAPVMVQNLKSPEPEEEEKLYLDKVIQYFSTIIANGLKLPAERIKANENFEALGIDSILTMHLTDELEKIFGTLPKTLFFEYSTVAELSRYFLDEYTETVQSCVPKDKRVKEENEASKEEQIFTPDKRIISKTFRDNNTICGKMQEHDDVAIIGLAGKYPMADNPEEFFENLCKGMDCITEIPQERWNYQLYYDEDKKAKGKSNCKWGGFINGVDEFDPLFFHISPREAEITDPQERLFLQCVYEAMEDAGYTKDNICEKEEGDSGCNVGVFVGSMTSEYQLYGAQEQAKGNMAAVNGINASIANRVSYYFNFNGPSMSLDTQCSSSLTAIHLACRSIYSGECNVAIAGGVNLTIHPNKYLLLSNGNFMASNGRCMSFGEGGDGYVPGEGVGSVILKPLHKAIKDGDNIYAVIKGTAVNHGGKTNGYTVPNPNMQSRVIEKAILNAGIDARAVSYIEAHGTGTSLGDPIEIKGMTKAFRKFTDDNQFCAIGSVKSNIGHCEGAAGMAAITKVIKQMQYKKLVPSIHSETLNPYIQFDNTPFTVQRELADWKRPVLRKDGQEAEYPRIAGISSFGAGGSNAHIILEEYVPEDVLPVEEEKRLIFIISAKTKEQLRIRARRLYDAAKRMQYSVGDLEAVSYTLAAGRETMDYRAGFTASTFEEYCDSLLSLTQEQENNNQIYQGKTEENNPLTMLLGYEELQDIMIKIAGKGKYEKLIQLWIYGYDVKWTDLFDIMGVAHRRISLPPYPFAKEKYWLNVTNKSAEKSPELKNSAATCENLCIQDTNTQHTEIIKVQWKKEERKPEATYDYYQKICICINTGELARQIEGNAQEWKVVVLDDTASGVKQLSKEIFLYVKELLQGSGSKRTRLIVFAPYGDISNIYSGLSGLLRTVSLENPNLITTLIEVEPNEPYNVESLLLENASVRHVRYQQSERHILDYKSIKKAYAADYHFTDKGVYVITGGAGGLGRIFAEEIAGKSKNSHIVLTGRSKINDNIRAFLELLHVNGNTAEYKSVNVQNAADVEEMMQRLRQQYGKITGIIHAAGINRDRYIIMKTADEFEEVLGPKAEGTINLDIATSKDNLEFFICFSSVSGCFGNIGQADYAAGNAFMDGYMEARSKLVQKGFRSGKSISVNWPLWRNGGMHVDRQTEAMLEKNSGLAVLSTRAGVEAFYTILNSEGYEFICLAGDAKKYGKLINRNEENHTEGQTAAWAEKVLPSSQKIGEQFDEYLKELLSDAIKLAPEKIDMEASMDTYGIDSVMTLEMTEELEKVFGNLSKTLFFEHKSLRALSKYLMQNYRNEIEQLLTIPSEENPAEEAEGKEEDSIKADTEMSLPQNIHSIVAEDKHGTQEIAIIGLAGKYPGAQDVEALWDNLLKGVDCVTRIPKSRWNNEKYFNPDKSVSETINGDWGGFIDGIDEFDPTFFKIAPRDAEYMDPQERLFLECVYHAIEDAGYTRKNLVPSIREDLGSNVGVFVGTVNNEYQLYGASEQEKGHLIAMNGGVASIANRVSYFCNFCGPSMAVDSQCSSSMTAIYLACESLLDNQCEAAIAGGVNLLLHPNRYIMLSGGKFLSSKGQCAAFGAGGDGYVPGEGVGAVLLKPLDKAIRDHDHIYGVIKGIAVNHGGKTNGFTVPNPNAQEELIGRVLKKSKIDPRTISYVEAHGTGTSLGDPIEIAGLTNAYRKFTDDKQYCSIGSVKSNIGHCEGAAGVASITKVLLQMKYHTLVPSIHTEELNPYIDYANTPFAVQQRKEEWKNPVVMRQGKAISFPRRAAISGFGAGGSNVHMIIEEYTGNRDVPFDKTKSAYIIQLSAQSVEQLKILAEKLKSFAARHRKEEILSSIAATLALGREPQEYRLAVLAETMDELIEQLQMFLQGVNAGDKLFYGKCLSKAERKKLGVENLTQEVAECKKNKNRVRLIQLWLQGFEINWELLYPLNDNTWTRISLPLYPFSKERCWLEQRERTVSKEKDIHIQKGTVRFSYTGNEYIVSDHLLIGRKIIAETSFYGMVCKAARQNGLEEEPFALQNIHWHEPLIVKQSPFDVEVKLQENGNFTLSGIEEGQYPNGNCTGNILPVAAKTNLFNIAESIRVCKNELEVKTCYELLKELGLNYGKSFKTLQEIYFNNDLCIAKVNSKNTVGAECGLYPELLTGAIQACVVFCINEQHSIENTPCLPFTMDKVVIYGDCEKEMWAVIDKEQTDKHAFQYNISLCDSNGEVKVYMEKGYVIGQ